MNVRQICQANENLAAIVHDLRLTVGGLPEDEGIRSARLLNIAEQLEGHRIEIANTIPATE